MKKSNEKVNVSKLFANAKKEWKQVNKSLMFTLNVTNNTIKGGGAPELKKYVNAIHDNNKIMIDYLCKDSKNNVCILKRVNDNVADTLKDFACSGSNRVALQAIGAHEYIITPKGAVYMFVQLANDKGGFSFVDLITSLNDKLRVDAFGTQIVEREETYTKDVRKQVCANYLEPIKGTKRAKRVTRPACAKRAKRA